MNPFSALLFVGTLAAVVGVPIWALPAPPERKYRPTVGAWMGLVALLGIPLAVLRAEGSPPAARWLALLGIYALPIVIARLYVRPGWDSVAVVGWICSLAGALVVFG